MDAGLVVRCLWVECYRAGGAAPPRGLCPSHSGARLSRVGWGHRGDGQLCGLERSGPWPAPESRPRSYKSTKRILQFQIVACPQKLDPRDRSESVSSRSIRCLPEHRDRGGIGLNGCLTGAHKVYQQLASRTRGKRCRRFGSRRIELVIGQRLLE
jgi:hypothetical protein